MTPKSKYWARMMPHLDKMRDRFNAGVLVKDIAAEFNVGNPQMVSAFLDSWGMNRRKPSAVEALTPYKDEILHKLHVDQKLLSDVAKDYGVCAATISRIRKIWLGDDWHALHGSKLNRHENDIITRWINDQSMVDIAVVYQVHHTSIWQALYRWGCLSGE